MQRFKNILFVTSEVHHNAEVLKDTLLLVKKNNAALKVLVLCPEFPTSFSEYIENYKKSLIEKVVDSIQDVRNSLKIGNTESLPHVEVESGNALAVRIIRHVVRDQYDLVMKVAELKEDEKGFASIDMELLRKCPCPIWLCRRNRDNQKKPSIAVAIDPQIASLEKSDLAIQLLKIAYSLSESYKGTLTVVSCWDYEFEEVLRNSMWAGISDEKLFQIVKSTQDQHRIDVQTLIQKSCIDQNAQLELIRGLPDKKIPIFVEDQEIDILVIGTIGRTGIVGYIIGNTAENIFQKIYCSVLALKPQGFVCPIKAS